MFIILSLGLGLFASQVHSPLFFKLRYIDYILSLLGAIGLIFLILKYRHRMKKNWIHQFILYTLVCLNVSIVIYTSFIKLRFYYQKQIVWKTGKETLQRYGRHIILGYTDEKEIEMLIKNVGIRGVFLSPKNVRNKSRTELKQMIQNWKTIYCRESGGEELIVTADMEGGMVSRLSPPLRYYQTPGEVYTKEGIEGVKKYAGRKARDLKDIGINMNLSPVVDLQKKPSNANVDLHTQIWKRAISKDPVLVEKVAGAYIEAMLKEGVFPVIKHFPGLARIHKDTHFFTAEIKDALKVLGQTDWLPFWKLPKKYNTGIMLGFVKIQALDKNLASPFSSKVISFLRQEAAPSHILLSDDFSMGPAFYHEKNIGELGFLSLRAGLDLLLISYDHRLYYPMIYTLLKKGQRGEASQFVESENRLKKQFSGRQCN